VGKHNLRLFKNSEEFDREKIEVLRGSRSSILDSVKQIYRDEFNEALRRYNDGKRPDRQIPDYLKHVSDSRSDCAAEIIIQVGDMDFWKNKDLGQRQRMTEIFADQIESLEKLVPEFKIASAVVHYDEASPHLHIVGVPVAENYRHGLERQVAKTKVFTADRLGYLQDRMRQEIEQSMRHGKVKDLFEGMELKEKELGRNKDIPISEMENYRKLQRASRSLQKDVEGLKAKKGILTSAEVTKSRSAASRSALKPGKVILPQQDYEKIMETASVVDFSLNHALDLKKREADLAKRKEEIEIEGRKIIAEARLKADSLEKRIERANGLNELKAFKNLEKRFPDQFKTMKQTLKRDQIEVDSKRLFPFDFTL
jgi:hypothetical protein